MAQEFLSDAEIALLQDAGCEGVTQHVGVNFTADESDRDGPDDTVYLASGQVTRRVGGVEGEAVEKMDLFQVEALDQVSDGEAEAVSCRHVAFSVVFGDWRAKSEHGHGVTGEHKVGLPKLYELTDSQTSIEHKQNHTVVAGVGAALLAESPVVAGTVH